MIGKVMINKNFDGCAKYVLSSKGARILEAKGIRTESQETIIHDFNMQRKANPNLSVAAGHIALSWSPNDTGKLTPDRMAAHSREYLEKMKITKTQYLIVQHQDRKHPHVHIIYNRVNNDCKSISDQFQKYRNVKVCKELTQKYGYHFALGKDRVNTGQLNGVDKIKYDLSEALSIALKYSANWKELTRILKHDAIGIQFHCVSGGQKISGVSFRKGDISIKGSGIDRSLSFQNITKQLTSNESLVLGNREWMDIAEPMNNASSLASAPFPLHITEIAKNAARAIYGEHSANEGIGQPEDSKRSERPTMEYDDKRLYNHSNQKNETISEIPYKRKR